MTSNKIRQQFLDFFASKQHHIVPSAPIVVKNDPTLLFTNAGMNQFKEFFLGNKKSPYPRIADTQKCLRVSGKHNDLEEVGVDTYHHTMFEMLGNWSFGDYFKKEAIAWSWELLTEVYQLDKNKLYVTVFEGSKDDGLPADDEALNEWKKYVPENRILFGNKKDNFWEMGDTGPCGPCTEIHYDSRTQEEINALNGSELVNKDHPQVIEIWNNVFIQFNRLKNGTLEPLPEKHVDTGMGLERLVRVLQKKQSNYETDLFIPTIQATEKITGKEYNNTQDKKDIAFRVIADHIRAIAFTIADGQLPSNTGAGYVIRRILRRAVRYYYSWLDYKQPLLYQLLPVVAEGFKNIFQELDLQKEFLSKVIREEEEAFLRTLEKGLKKMDDIIETLQHKNETEISGEFAFELFDTYGFPPDLTSLIAAENNLTVNQAGFEKHMLQQKERSRAATAIDTGDWIILEENAVNEFVGYHSFEIKSKVTRYRKISSKGKEQYQLVLDATPFYAESGGQVGDTGTLYFNEEAINVTDTKKENQLIVHFTSKLPKELQHPVLAKVDIVKRKATAIHHTATHLLHAALRKVLGDHVVQKGSLVNSEYLRFDFSHFSKLSAEEIISIEKTVNEKIRENIPVIIQQKKKDEAITMGAMALFGEKYGEEVRVVIIDPSYSIELCGGTHVSHTGQLGFFKIVQEASIASGVRRIEAVCGNAAEQLVLEQFNALSNISEMLRHPKDLTKSVHQLLQENSNLKKRIESLEAAQLALLEKEIIKAAEDVNGVQFLGSIVSVNNAEALKKLCFDVKKHLSNYLVVLIASIDGKAYVAIAVDENVIETKNTDAATLIKQVVAPLIKGGGGGQKSLATAGGQDSSNLPVVINAVKKSIQ